MALLGRHRTFGRCHCCWQHEISCIWQILCCGLHKTPTLGSTSRWHKRSPFLDSPVSCAHSMERHPPSTLILHLRLDSILDSQGSFSDFSTLRGRWVMLLSVACGGSGMASEATRRWHCPLGGSMTRWPPYSEARSRTHSNSPALRLWSTTGWMLPVPSPTPCPEYLANGKTPVAHSWLGLKMIP